MLGCCCGVADLGRDCGKGTRAVNDAGEKGSKDARWGEDAQRHANAVKDKKSAEELKENGQGHEQEKQREEGGWKKSLQKLLQRRNVNRQCKRSSVN